MRRRAGFTILEMLVVIGIMAIMSAMSIVGFTKLRSREDAREATRNLIANSHRARNAALSLGVAANTPRAILDATCQDGFQAAFSSVGGAANGRAAIVFQRGVARVCGGAVRTGCCPTADPCDVITYVADIRRQASGAAVWNGDDYILICRSELVARSGELRLDNRPFTGFQATLINGTPSFYVPFDQRGFVAQEPSAAVYRVPLISQDAQLKSNVLVLGSGYSCSEGRNDECLRRN